MTSPAKQFNKTPVTKFGVQAEKPPKVVFWRLGEKHDVGEQVLIKNFRTLDQLEKKMAQQLRMMPSLYGIFTVHGKRVKDLAEIHEGMDLVAVQTGHKFLADKLPTALIAKMKAMGGSAHEAQASAAAVAASAMAHPSADASASSTGSSHAPAAAPSSATNKDDDFEF